MKAGSFVINGLKSQDVNAVITNWFDTTLPKRKVTLNGSPAKLDRALIYDDASYENREFTIPIGINGDSVVNRNNILDSINYGSYINAQFYFDPDYQYQIIVDDIITTERPSRNADYLSIAVKVSGAPFKYLIDAPEVTTTGTTTIINPSKYPSRPIITLAGTGDMELTVNDQTYNFKGIDSGIIVDSSVQDAYWLKSGTVYNRNSTMSHSAFPSLNPGSNTVSVSGATATIEPRWRSL